MMNNVLALSVHFGFKTESAVGARGSFFRCFKTETAGWLAPVSAAGRRSGLGDFFRDEPKISHRSRPNCAGSVYWTNYGVVCRDSGGCHRMRLYRFDQRRVDGWSMGWGHGEWHT
jgi:hypothetical protein